MKTNIEVLNHRYEETLNKINELEEKNYSVKDSAQMLEDKERIQYYNGLLEGLKTAIQLLG